LRAESSKFFSDGFAVIFDVSGADVTPGGEDVVVGCDLFDAGALAESGDLFVGIFGIPVPPIVVRACDLVYVVGSQDTQSAILHLAEFASVYKKHLSTTIPVTIPCSVLRYEPESHWDTSVKE
jgi:hypothetical protein